MLEVSTDKRAIEPTAISEDYLSGYHRCCLEKPYHLDYTSQDMCNILGYTPAEIHNLFHDKYSEMVYEADRPKYLHFINELASKEQTLTLKYRMVCKDGHMIYIHDTMTSRRLENGLMYGFAVIADITNTQHIAPVLTDPTRLIGRYGFLQCTCEKYPKVTHINDQMMKYLGVTEDDSGWQNFLKDNIFFMIPFEQRDNFRAYLEAALNSSEPINIEHQIIQNDGTQMLLTGWLSVVENKPGEKEYVFIYMHADNNLNKMQSNRENSYFNALKSAYNIIFEINLNINTVECIHGRETSDIGALYDIHMTFQSAKNFWLNNYIVEEDRVMMRNFLNQLSIPREPNDPPVIQVEFHIKWVDKVIHYFLGVAVHLDDSTILFCCRDITRSQYSVVLKNENFPQDKDTSAEPAPPKGIFARTFGHFDLFVDGLPITFSSNKEKELMALLIDRNGGTLSASEAISYLWENEAADERVSSRYRKLAMSLKNTLAKYGIEHILINHRGVRSINVSAIKCDYYELLAGNEQYKNSFHNSYMSDYSWAEETLATLWDYSYSIVGL